MTGDPCADAAGVDCAEAVRQLGRYLDGELEEQHLDEVRAHLRACYPCADRAGFEEHLRAIVRATCCESAPDGLLDRIRTRLDATEHQA